MEAGDPSRGRRSPLDGRRSGLNSGGHSRGGRCQPSPGVAGVESTRLLCVAWKDGNGWEEDGAVSDADWEQGLRSVGLVGGMGWNFSFEQVPWEMLMRQLSRDNKSAVGYPSLAQTKGQD